MNKDALPYRIKRIRQTISEIDSFLGTRKYSERDVRNFLREAKKLIESGELRIEPNGEISSFPESMPNIVEMILAYVRATRKIELIHLEAKLDKQILKGLLLSGSPDDDFEPIEIIREV